MSQLRAGRLVGLQRSTLRYRAPESSPDPVRERLRALAQERPRFGYRRLTALLAREGTPANHQRVYRLCRELKRPVSRKKRKRLVRAAVTTAPTTSANQRWAMDFVADATSDGRALLCLAVVDTHTRECLAIEVDCSLPSARVVRVLARLAAERGAPEAIRCDNGPEFVSAPVRRGSEESQVKLDHIRPGQPVENAYAESFNGRLRDECLNAHWFTGLRDARAKIEAWREDYNERRPHSSLAWRTPAAFRRQLEGRASFALADQPTAPLGPPPGSPGGALARGQDPGPAPPSELRL